MWISVGWPFGRKRVIRELECQVAKLTTLLKVEREINATMRKSLALAVDPRNMSADRIQALMDEPGAHERMAAALPPTAVRMPDGEIVLPQAYNWERLAHDMYDRREDQGGASGEW